MDGWATVTTQCRGVQTIAAGFRDGACPGYTVAVDLVSDW